MQNRVIGNPGWKYNVIVPAGLSLPLLGLDKNAIDLLRGKRVLDFGCGNGGLVAFLRSRGIEAEGIDPEAPEGVPYLMKRFVAGTGEEAGIPRPDGHYSLITCFQVPPINIAFRKPSVEEMLANSDEDGVSEEYRARLGTERSFGQALVQEMIRATAKGGSVVIFPEHTMAISNYAPELFHANGISLFGKPVLDVPAIKAYARWEHRISERLRGGVDATHRERYEATRAYNDDIDCFSKRTVIEKGA
jgi:SAM-dependent methyltransferase